MLHLGHETIRCEAGFTVKTCVLCLSHRLHAVQTSSTEFAGFAFDAKAWLICTGCGLEREVDGDAGAALIERVVPRLTVVETIDERYLDGGLDAAGPAGTEWLIPEDEADLAA